ncbi:MAG: VCBS repeat-containing protein [Polyangiales bacterium]
MTAVRLLVSVCLFSTLAACAPFKRVVTDGASGTDINNDRRADLIAVSRTNGTMTEPHGALVMPGGLSGFIPASATGIATFSDGTWGARVGDVNNDGYSDFILGSDSGSGPYDVRVFLGGTTITQQMASLRSPRRDDGSTGKSMGSAAWDLNGDGFADVVIVRKWRTVAVHFGGASGLRPDPDQTLQLGDTDPIADLRGVGDIDGDGHAEIAFIHRINGNDTVRVHRGTAMGLEPTPALELVNVTGGVSDRVDVTGDGRFDLVVGQIEGTGGCINVFAGEPNALRTPRPAGSVCASRPTGVFAQGRVLRAGDTNADGYDDVMLFEPGLASECAAGAPVAFRVRLFKGTAHGLEPRDSVAVNGPPAQGCAIGEDALAVGDVHGDGHADVVIGLPGFRSTMPGADGDGRLMLYRGGPEGLRADGSLNVDAPVGSGWGLGRFAR